jgi:hypothetical protein
MIETLTTGYLRWRTISPEGISRPVVSVSALIPQVEDYSSRGYLPPSSQCVGIDTSGGGLLIPRYLSSSNQCVGIDTSGGGLLVPGGIFSPVVSALLGEDTLRTNSPSPEVSMSTH